MHRVCVSLLAAVTNYHTFHNIKQEEFIFSQFWRPDARNQFHWMEIEFLSGPHLLWRFLGRICSFFSFWWLLVFHGVIRLCCRIEYNRSVAKFKRWGRTTEGRDEHMISAWNIQHTWGSEERASSGDSALGVCLLLMTMRSTHSAAYMGSVAASCYSKEPLPLLCGVWKLSVCLRATDTHIAKQFQENLRPSRVKVIVLSVLWDLGVQYSLWACQHIFCTQFLLETRGGSGLLLDPPCTAGILDLWPCHSSLFFLIAVSLLVWTTSPSVTNSLWVLGQNSHPAIPCWLYVMEQMTPHLQVMIDHTHTHNRPWFPSRLAKEITSITLLPSSQGWPWFDPWVLISLSAWISHQHPSLSMCPCCCFSITLGLWACLSFSFGWPSRT